VADCETPRIAGTFPVQDLTRDAASRMSIYGSDSELKEEIRAIDSATARVAALRGNRRRL
jgi:hypothetical protein